MNKKVLEYSLLLKIVIRLSAVGILFGMGITQMPTIIFLTSALICGLGFTTFFRSNALHKSVKEIDAFLILEMAIITFNMVYMAVVSPLTVELYDTLLTGSLLDLIVNVSLIAYSKKQHKYTMVDDKSSTIKSVRRSKKAYVRPIQNLEIR